MRPVPCSITRKGPKRRWPSWSNRRANSGCLSRSDVATAPRRANGSQLVRRKWHDEELPGSSFSRSLHRHAGRGPLRSLSRASTAGRRFAAALLPRLFGTNPRSHHKGATGRVRTGNQRLPVLCHCQLGQDIPTALDARTLLRPENYGSRPRQLARRGAARLRFLWVTAPSRWTGASPQPQPGFDRTWHNISKADCLTTLQIERWCSSSQCRTFIFFSLPFSHFSLHPFNPKP